MSHMRPIPLIALLLMLAGSPARAAEGPAPSDTMTFQAVAASPDTSKETEVGFSASIRLNANGEGEWLRAPIGDNLITHPDPWRAEHKDSRNGFELGLDFNRVDQLRWGGWYQAQDPSTMYPRLGARLEYATGRHRMLYGVQLEQPLLPTARFVLGVGMTRRTDHPELQQVDDVENSLALLLSHEDWRDYYEREGIGAYLSWRVPDFSTVSVHMRRDDYRSLSTAEPVRSWFHRDRHLRRNPAVDEGESHSALLRLERLAHREKRLRTGTYHWIEFERSGGQLGGDFDYTRALADLRSIVRLSPAVSLALRGVAGSALDGELPRQKQFGVGGVDGLRAHSFEEFRGDQMALVQAEYSLGLWQLSTNGLESGLHAIVFVDAGTAWSSPSHWNVGDQHFAVDGGVGLATSEDDLRVTFARDLQDPDSEFVVSMRLQRPF